MRNCEKDMQLVPFGKYKGQPVEVMQMDTAYCDWLSKQSWFREQYSNVYNQVIINNFTEPTETPEHNRLQMRFLDEAFISRFVSKKLLPAISATDIPKKPAVNWICLGLYVLRLSLAWETISPLFCGK